MLDFEKRKRDHIEISLSEQSQSDESSGFEKIELVHEALPDINFHDIQICTQSLNLECSSPFFVSAMTLGHKESESLNDILARVCERRNIFMAVGSQRRQLTDPTAAKECIDLRKQFPQLKVFGNIGISQLILMSEAQTQDLVDSLDAQGLIVHANPLQECLQTEGTPQFKGSFEALEKISGFLKVPVVLKETGSGFSSKTLQKLTKTKIAAIDVSGRGGTHWGRVETLRAKDATSTANAADRLGSSSGLSPLKARAGDAFKNWGVSTVDSTQAAVALKPGYEVWASGGVRTGVDAAKLLALGAQMIGLAQPILRAAIQGEDALDTYLDGLELELKIAMFCTGCSNIRQLRTQGVLKWI